MFHTGLALPGREGEGGDSKDTVLVQVTQFLDSEQRVCTRPANFCIYSSSSPNSIFRPSFTFNSGGGRGGGERERQSSKEQVGGSFFIIFHSHVLFQSRGGGTCKQCCKIHSNTPRVETSGGRQGLPSACKTRREGRGKLLRLQVFLKFASGFLSPPFLLYCAEHSSYTNAVCTYTHSKNIFLNGGGDGGEAV